jgi:hypothetical protein
VIRTNRDGFGDSVQPGENSERVGVLLGAEGTHVSAFVCPWEIYDKNAKGERCDRACNQPHMLRDCAPLNSAWKFAVVYRVLLGVDV